MIKEINNMKRLNQVFTVLRRQRLEVGILGEQDSFISMVAIVNEFGISIEVTDKMRKWFAAQGYPLNNNTSEIKIPERSFIRTGFDVNVRKMQSYSNKQLKQLIEFKITIDQFYDRLGSYFVSRLKEYLTDLQDPANSPMTKERKGSSNPLIGQDSRLRNSIIFRVVNI